MHHIVGLEDLFIMFSLGLVWGLSGEKISKGVTVIDVFCDHCVW